MTAAKKMGLELRLACISAAEIEMISCVVRVSLA